MPLYSHSRLNTFEQCPLRFKFHYIDKVETEIETTIEGFLGSRVHEALEKLYKDLKFEKLLTINELIEFYNSRWEKEWNPGILIVREEYSEDNYRKMGERFIRDYYKRFHPFNQSRTIGLETEDTVALDDEGRYKIHIRIDRLALAEDNVYEIHDYKTSNVLPTQEKLDSDRQLAVYAYGIKKMYPDAKKIRLIWHFLAFDKTMVSERSDEQLESLKDEIIALIKSIESTTDFKPKQSALCGWCQFQQICPNFKHKYKVLNNDIKDDGVELADKYARLYEDISSKEKELEEVKQKIFDYAEKEGINVLYGSDVQLTIRSYPRLSFPKKGDPLRFEFRTAVKDIGLWNDLETIDTYELAKMINNNKIHPELMAVLGRFITRGVTKRIYLKRI